MPARQRAMARSRCSRRGRGAATLPTRSAQVRCEEEEDGRCPTRWSETTPCPSCSPSSRAALLWQPSCPSREPPAHHASIRSLDGPVVARCMLWSDQARRCNLYDGLGARHRCRRRPEGGSRSRRDRAVGWWPARLPHGWPSLLAPGSWGRERAWAPSPEGVVVVQAGWGDSLASRSGS